MRLSQVAEVLEAVVLVGHDHLDREVAAAGGCDMISDLLFFGKPGMLLLTGLTQPAVVRTAQLMDIAAVVFVQGKRPDEDTVEFARAISLPLLASPYPLYECSGRLYAQGIPGVIPVKGCTAAAGRS